MRRTWLGQGGGGVGEGGEGGGNLGRSDMPKRGVSVFHVEAMGPSGELKGQFCPHK